MATLSLDLNKKATDAEIAMAQRLQVAALTKNMPEVERLMKDKTIKALFKRGVLRVGRTVFQFNDEEYDLS